MRITGINRENFDAVSGCFPKDVSEFIDKEEYTAYAVLTEGGELAGLVSFEEEKTEDIYAARLDWIFVVPEYRGQGLAAYMLKEVKERLKAAGVSVLYTDIPQDSEYSEIRSFLKAVKFDIEDGYLLDPDEDIEEISITDNAAMVLDDGEEADETAGADELLMALHPDMPYLIPRLNALDSLLADEGLDIDMSADNKDGPYILIKDKKGMDIRMAIGLIPDEPENFVIYAISEKELSGKQGEACEALIEEWEDEVQLASAGYDEAAGVIRFLAALPCEEGMPGKDELKEFVKGFKEETDVFNRLLSEVK